MTGFRSAAALLLLSAMAATPAFGENLYVPGNWSALAADMRASHVGDVLTIVIYESATASNSASSGSKKSSRVEGSITAGDVLNESAGLKLGGGSDNQGTNGRSGRMVAQISATVEEVLPNGDLRVAGTQLLNLSGERTAIKVKGRVRAADITGANIVLSSRLADAQIDYDGSGFVSRSGKPGIVSRIFNFLGLM